MIFVLTLLYGGKNIMNVILQRVKSTPKQTKIVKKNIEKDKQFFEKLISEKK